MESILPDEIDKLIESKNKNITLEESPNIINEIINLGIQSNLNEYEINEKLHAFAKLSNDNEKNINKISKKLIHTRFTKSVINNVKKEKIKNKNVIFRNTLEHVEELIELKNIDINNLLDNIYDISENLIEFVNKYDISNDEKNKLISQILLNLLDNLIDKIPNISKDDEAIIENIKIFIKTTLPFFIQGFVNADLNDESILEIKKNVIQIIFSCILKNQ